jgi:hypothetical protein
MKKLIIAVSLAVVFYGCDFTTLPPLKATVHEYLSDLSAIPAPAKDRPPLSWIETPEYQGSVRWRTDGGAAFSGNFQEGEKYTAVAALVPKDGFTFAGFAAEFFHRGAETVSQSVSADSAVVTVSFAPLLFTDADFLSLSGVREKTFYMVPDLSTVGELQTPSVSGTGTYTVSGYGSMGHPESGSYSYICTFRISFPSRALFYPGTYTVSGSGSVHASVYNVGSNLSFSPTPTSFSGRSVSLSLNIPNNRNITTYEYSEEEEFGSPSYSLPVSGYSADRNFLHLYSLTHTIALSSDQARTLSGIQNESGYNGMTYPHPALSSSLLLTHPFRQQSRDFYRYRTISAAFDPAVQIISCYDNLDKKLIDRFEIDEETNTVTVFLKHYNVRTTGEIFYILIVAEDGSYHLKTVSIEG